MDSSCLQSTLPSTLLLQKCALYLRKYFLNKLSSIATEPSIQGVYFGGSSKSIKVIKVVVAAEPLFFLNLLLFEWLEPPTCKRRDATSPQATGFLFSLSLFLFLFPR